VNLEAGTAARDCLRDLRQKFIANARGPNIETIPDVDESTTTADMIVIAEVLRATMTAFLSPEDIQERGRLGFHID